MQVHDAVALARDLLRQHGLEGWTVVLDGAKTRAGVCRPGRREIGLSRPLTVLHTEAEVRDTILHEIAHALVGAEHGHDAVWQAKARDLGCPPTRCMTSRNGRLEGAWKGTCPAGHVVTRHRRPERVQSCTVCSSTFDPAAVFTWTHRGRQADMHPAYVAESAALGTRAVLPPGAEVRLLGTGRFAGLTGTVVAFGRTRYRVQTQLGLISAPLILVEAV